MLTIPISSVFLPSAVSLAFNAFSISSFRPRVLALVSLSWAAASSSCCCNPASFRVASAAVASMDALAVSNCACNSLTLAAASVETASKAVFASSNCACSSPSFAAASAPASKASALAVSNCAVRVSTCEVIPSILALDSASAFEASALAVSSCVIRVSACEASSFSLALASEETISSAFCVSLSLASSSLISVTSTPIPVTDAKTAITKRIASFFIFPSFVFLVLARNLENQPGYAAVRQLDAWILWCLFSGIIGDSQSHKQC